MRRVVAMLVNEAVDALDLGFATAADIETAMTKGVNYPQGLLAWGDEIGPAKVLMRDRAAAARVRRSALSAVARALRTHRDQGGSLLHG